MSSHISVLMNEVIQGLDIHSDDIVVDGTINGGGHARVIANHLGENSILIGIDQDSAGLDISRERLSDVKPKIHLIHDNARNLDCILETLGISSCDKIFFDLGWSSNQFEDAHRGFSFLKDGPLLMKLTNKKEINGFTAYDIVNDWSESSLIDIFIGYGNVRFPRRIVKAIITAREQSPIKTTQELAKIITEAIPKKFQKSRLHPATQSFQALRIAVNDEIRALREMLEKGFKVLNSGGRIVVISFHSIEDRIVKHYFKKQKKAGLAEMVTKKPITPGVKELLVNNRARSAKLRILKKL